MYNRRKTLSVSARNKPLNGKFQADLEPVDVLDIDEIAERWSKNDLVSSSMAKTMIRSLEEFIVNALADGYQLNFGLVSFYPRLSGALPSRDSDPESEGLFVRGAVKARTPLMNGLKDKLDAVNKLSSVRPRLFSILDKENNAYDRIAPGHAISAVGYDIDIDVSDPDEGVWLERRTCRGYQKVVKANVLHSDPGRVEFVVDGELPPRKYAVTVYTRSGRGKSYKVVCCRREVSIIR
jgi:hypothetical protein